MKKQVLLLLMASLVNKNIFCSAGAAAQAQTKTSVSAPRIDVKKIGSEPLFAGKKPLPVISKAAIENLNAYMISIWQAMKGRDYRKLNELLNNPPYIVAPDTSAANIPRVDKNYALTIALTEAIYLGDVKLIEYLLLKGADVNSRNISARDELRNQTPLQIADQLAKELGGVYINIEEYLRKQDVQVLRLEFNNRLQTVQEFLRKIKVVEKNKQKLIQLNVALEKTVHEGLNVIQRSELVRLLKALNVLSNNITSLTTTKKGVEPIRRATALPSATSTLLMFLDDSEKELAPITWKFMEAVRENVGPILVSWHVFCNAFGRPSLSQLMARGKSDLSDQATFTKQRYDMIVKKLRELIPSNRELTDKNKGEVLGILNKEFPDINKKILLEALRLEIVDFDPQAWIMRQSDAFDLVLLIPRDNKMIKKYGYNPARTASKVVSPLELALGLKVDHWAELSEKSFNEMVGYSEKFKNPQRARYMQHFDKALAALFVSRKEYNQYNVAPSSIVRWAIYMNGHGGVQTQIVGLPIAQFVQSLDFFDTKIVTVLLVYSSCYAAGTNVEIIYKEATEYGTEKDRAYSYVIASGGVVDAPQGSVYIDYLEDFVLGSIDFARKNLRIALGFNFAEFIRQATESQAINYSDALSNILQTTGEVREIAQIRLPGLAWFNVLDINNHIVSITNTLAKSQSKPLSIKKLFETQTKKAGSNLQAILLYAPIIPFEILIDTEKKPNDFSKYRRYESPGDTKIMPKFISMLPYVGMHHIKKISVQTKASLQDIFKSLLQIDFAVQKIIWIDELEFDGQEVTVDHMPSYLSSVQDVIVTGYMDQNLGIYRKGIYFKSYDIDRFFVLDSNSVETDYEKQI